MRTPRPSPSDRAGFSLIEAMLVLIIGGVALIMVFAIGGRAAQIGFGLGGRALAVGDHQLADDSLRVLIAGLSIAPTASVGQSAGIADIRGASDSFAGEAVLDRSTLCAPAGPAPRVNVRIESGRGGDVVSCQIGQGPRIVLLDLRPRRASFAYSEDGVRWSDRWSSSSRLGAESESRGHERALFIRLSSSDGTEELVGRAASGRPGLYSPRQSAAPGANVGL